MKDQLLNAYKLRQADFRTVRETYPDVDMAGPFLISPSEQYNGQPFPLLVVGQETNGWDYHIDDLTRQMDVYERFNVGEEYYASPFWNITRKVEKALGNSPYSCVWTNISKYDVDGGRAYGAHAEAIATLDNILQEEMRILQPKVCLFFTGVDFDDRIKSIFPGVEFQSVTNYSRPDRLYRLVHPLLPTLTFRSDHPKYLRISKQENSFIEFIQTLKK